MQGRYCHQCGQENIEPRESVGSLVKHFVLDLLHYDGKFFTSLKYLLFRPGFLTKEYIKGKRARYFNPIRMYLFASAVFFLLVFNLPSAPVNVDTNEIDLDSIPIATATVSAYDSLQQKLPAEERDGRLKQWVNRKFRGALEKHKGRESEFVETLTDRFIHLLPTWMMISLPLFAFILLLLHIRNRTFYFADHMVFTLHLYIAQYLLLIPLIGVVILQDFLKWSALSWLSILLTVLLLFYTYKALRNFYQQSRTKTLLKFFLLLCSMCLMILFMILGMGLQTILFV